MRALFLTASTMACAAFSICSAVASDWEQSRDWFIETKRAAKYARIAITGTADLARIDAEQAAATKQLRAAALLPLAEADKAICTGAAQAVVDFIAAGKAGNMTSGPASFERQYERWSLLSDGCIRAIQQRTSAR